MSPPLVTFLVVQVLAVRLCHASDSSRLQQPPVSELLHPLCWVLQGLAVGSSRPLIAMGTRWRISCPSGSLYGDWLYSLASVVGVDCLSALFGWQRSHLGFNALLGNRPVVWSASGSLLCGVLTCVRVLLRQDFLLGLGEGLEVL